MWRFVQMLLCIHQFPHHIQSVFALILSITTSAALFLNYSSRISRADNGIPSFSKWCSYFASITIHLLNWLSQTTFVPWCPSNYLGTPGPAPKNRVVYPYAFKIPFCTLAKCLQWKPSPSSAASKIPSTKPFPL